MAQLIFIPFANGGTLQQIFRADLPDNGTNFYTVNTGFGLPDYEVCNVTVRNENNDIVSPDDIEFSTSDDIIIELTAARAENGGTLPPGYRVVVVG
jgi:hypothetical protein